MLSETDEEINLEIELTVRELARRNYRDFISYLDPTYIWEPFHEVIGEKLQQFANQEIKKLMITMPPQHGKSELSTRNFPPYLWGLNPNRKIAVTSYSAAKAQKFSREIQLRLTSEHYRCLFPKVRLATAKDEASSRTMQEFDIVGFAGSLKAVGRRGPLTGDPVDVVILDDLFKDNIEAQSPNMREQTWSDWIIPVVEARMHNDSQMLYVTTRWHEDDPAGRFLERDGIYSLSNPDGWVLLNFAALKTTDIVPYDVRTVGEALWPAKHSRHRMELVKKNNPSTFDALYQGDPKPSQVSTIFGDWIEVPDYPQHVDHEFVGLDFGFSNDPTAATRIGRIGRDLYLDELFYETGLTNPDILDAYHLTGLGSSVEVICDKAEPKSIEELKRGYWKEGNILILGINASGCDKGPGSINAGISKLKEFTVYYTSRSTNIKRECRNYTWVMAGGKATNIPIDRNNHAIDGIRSAVFTKYNKQPSTGRTTAQRVRQKQGRTY